MLPNVKILKTNHGPKLFLLIFNQGRNVCSSTWIIKWTEIERLSKRNPPEFIVKNTNFAMSIMSTLL